MSAEAARAALERMKTDAEFRDQVQAAEGVDARLALLCEAGYDCTPEELEAQGRSLSDEELDFAGGVVLDCFSQTCAGLGPLLG